MTDLPSWKQDVNHVFVRREHDVTYREILRVGSKPRHIMVLGKGGKQSRVCTVLFGDLDLLRQSTDILSTPESLDHGGVIRVVGH